MTIEEALTCCCCCCCCCCWFLQKCLILDHVRTVLENLMITFKLIFWKSLSKQDSIGHVLHLSFSYWLILFVFTFFFNLLPDIPILGSSNWVANKDMLWKILTNWDAIIWLSRKHCGKGRNCSLRAISPFPTMFSKAVCCWCVKTSIYGIKG